MINLQNRYPSHIEIRPAYHGPAVVQMPPPMPVSPKKKRAKKVKARK